MDISEFLGYAIPVISVFASYFCGRLQSDHQSKRDVEKERYENFYIPYIQLLYSGHIYSDIKSSDMSNEAILTELDLIMHNIQYLGKSSLSRVHLLYDSVLDMLEWNNGNEEFSSAPEKYDQEVTKFRKCVLLESSALSKALHLSDLGAQFLSLLDEESPSMPQPPEQEPN